MHTPSIGRKNLVNTIFALQNDPVFIGVVHAGLFELGSKMNECPGEYKEKFALYRKIFGVFSCVEVTIIMLRGLKLASTY